MLGRGDEGLCSIFRTVSSSYVLLLYSYDRECFRGFVLFFWVGGMDIHCGLSLVALHKKANVFVFLVLGS